MTAPHIVKETGGEESDYAARHLYRYHGAMLAISEMKRYARRN